MNHTGWADAQDRLYEDCDVRTRPNAANRGLYAPGTDRRIVDAESAVRALNSAATWVLGVHRGEIPADERLAHAVALITYAMEYCRPLPDRPHLADDLRAMTALIEDGATELRRLADADRRSED